MVANYHEIRLVNSYPPASIMYRGQHIPYAPFFQLGSWSFDPFDLHIIVSLGGLDMSAPVTLLFDFSNVGGQQYFSNGLRGAVKRATLAKVLFGRFLLLLSSRALIYCY